jgi:CubicO group peptidase (beta-lactamase class C family)
VDNLNPVGRTYYSFSTFLCVPNALPQTGGYSLGAQDGEEPIHRPATDAGFTRFRRVAETPFNIVYEARRASRSSARRAGNQESLPFLLVIAAHQPPTSVGIRPKEKESTMNRLRKTAMILLAVVTAATVVACSEVEQKINERVAGDAATELPLLIDAQVLSYLDNSNVPGATVAVTVNGRLVLSKGYGVADLDAGTQMQPWHRSRIGSVSKLITAIAALQLVEQGELDLDDHLYAADATPFWGNDPNGPPGVIYTDAGVLENPGDYYSALAAGVAELSESPDISDVLAPGENGPPDPQPPYLTQGDYQANVQLAFDWANQIRMRHVLSHTTGLLRSGSAPKAAEVFHNGNEDLVTYPEVHQAVLMGTSGPPLLFEAGTERKYSNHGFGLMGQVIAEVSGMPYEEFAYGGIFGPLGLTDVTPHGIALGPLDVTPYNSDSDGNPVENPYDITGELPLSTSTGGWIATAQDLVRVACGIDDVSNNLRLLDHDTVDTVWYPDASISHPMGWDSVKNGVLSKNGSQGQGAARVTKYLPGSLSDVEINVAVATNKRGAPPASLLNNIANEVAGTAIPDDFDLFTHHPCYVPPGLTNPQPSAGEPSPEPTFEPGLADPAPAPPTDSPPLPPPAEPSPPPPPPPAVGDPAIRASELWTLPDECGKPTETEVRAPVQAGSGLRSVELRWSTGDEEEQQATVDMVETATGFWSATLGPFNPTALLDGPEPFDPTPLTVTVVATDQHGQTSLVRAETTLYRCIPPAG